MDYVSAILLFFAAFTGLFPFIQLNSGMKYSLQLVFIHRFLVAAGTISLVIFAFVTEKHHKHVETIIFLVIAVIIESAANSRRISNEGKRGILIVYFLTGMFVLLWLLTFIIKT